MEEGVISNRFRQKHVLSSDELKHARIVHVCLGNFFIDGYGYQENLLSLEQMELGAKVLVIASRESKDINGNIVFIEHGRYINSQGIDVLRLEYAPYLPLVISNKIRKYIGLKNELLKYKPTHIFVHGPQTYETLNIKSYVASQPQDLQPLLFVDNHADLVNSAKGFISKQLLHKIYYRFCAKKLDGLAVKFYGTTISRCDFLKKIYGIKHSEIKPLYGGSTKSWSLKSKQKARLETYGAQQSIPGTLKIISGGKFDGRKNLKHLLEAIEFINRNNTRIELILFGRLFDSSGINMDKILMYKWVNFKGWIGQEQQETLIAASDLAVFPGTHSTLWEVSVGTQTPLIVKRWEGMQHINHSNNCIFLKNGETTELIEILSSFCTDPEKLKKISTAASQEKSKKFTYRHIAKTCISA